MLPRFARDRRGVAAVEFAIVVPLMLALYFLTMEVSQAIDSSRKVGRIASQIADLVAQQEVTSPGELDAIMKISQPLLQPYTRSEADITVTAIRVTDDNVPTARVVWSRKYADGDYAPALPEGAVVAIPRKLMARGSFLIRSEVDLQYWPILAWSAEGMEMLGVADTFFPMEMGERYYLQPRQTRAIACAAC